MLGRAIALAGMLVAFRREIPLGSKELAVARNRKTIHPSVTTPQNAILHSGKRDYAPELIRGSQGSGRDRPAFEGPIKETVTHKQPSQTTTPRNASKHSGKGDCPPELIRGSQVGGCDRPAFEGFLKNELPFGKVYSP